MRLPLSMNVCHSPVVCALLWQLVQRKQHATCWALGHRGTQRCKPTVPAQITIRSCIGQKNPLMTKGPLPRLRLHWNAQCRGGSKARLPPSALNRHHPPCRTVSYHLHVLQFARDHRPLHPSTIRPFSCITKACLEPDYRRATIVTHGTILGLPLQSPYL